MADQLLLSTLRVELNVERERLRAQIAALDAASESSLSYDENFADSGQVAAEQGENKSLLNQLQRDLANTERALAKLDDGTYGICEACGQPIAEARLEAMPATRYCVNDA